MINTTRFLFLNSLKSRSPIICSMFCSKGSKATPAVVHSMTVEKLQSIIKASQLQDFQLVDVREESELEMARLKVDGVINLPLSLAGQWTQQIQRGDLLDPEKPVLCMCHHGVRSMKMANFLIQNDFETVYNIEGGIAAYATEVDPSVGFY
jgi:rhodanese-related sulfurtransferase